MYFFCFFVLLLYSYLICETVGPCRQLPTRGSVSAAGYDLYSSEYSVIPPWSRKPINMGIAIAFPSGLYARVAPCSGLALKYIDVGAGVIDGDFRGLVKAVLINQSNTPFRIN